MENVEEGTSYGTPAFRANGVLFIRMWEDMETMVVRTDFEQRDEMIATDPGAYYLTDHYRNYPWILVRLSRIYPDLLSDLLRGAWRLASKERASKRPRTSRKPRGRSR